MNTILLLVAHGSPSKEALEQTEAFRRLFSERWAGPVELCYLEFAAPDLIGGLRKAAEAVGKDGKVIVLPLFLGAAGHQKNDLPVALRWAAESYPRVEFICSTPFEPHANLVALLDLRLREALQASANPLPMEETIVLVVGRGSSDPDSNSEVARTARLLYENRVYMWVEYAYQAVARPSIEAGVAHAALLGARHLVVAPYLLFTGWVENEILSRTSRLARRKKLPLVSAKTLGLHPLLVEVAAERAAQALRRSVGMTCDLCKYRLPLSGYEAQVGRPSHSHHVTEALTRLDDDG